ncbi:MAG: M20/M25/M40 family metallo-hydrolase [Alphaproteobacteria bacterium]|nr:M20/M25/M40 family metallo-hydrolase [Alphaproteobacteria bacterium]
MQTWRSRMAVELARRATPAHSAGLDASGGAVAQALAELGFDVKRIRQPGAAPLLVAHRPGRGPHTIGLAAHYDVELAGDGWSHAPFSLTEDGGRLFGRGIADNLGPLWLRIEALRVRQKPSPSLLWVIQGEEEIGSPFAHQRYPDLDLPPVDLWLEETGYFDLDGTQRLLAAHMTPDASKLLDAVAHLAAQDGRPVRVEDRYLNKAFGQNRCPFLTHLLRERPYLAVGPNDDLSQIHAPDESLPLSTLDLSVRQFWALLDAAVDA